MAEELAPLETPAQRYDREWLHIGDSRKVRGFDQRSEERIARDFNGAGVVEEPVEP